MNKNESRSAQTLPKNWWKMGPVLKRLQESILPTLAFLILNLRGKKSKQQSLSILSGFLANLDGKYFWVTAGHVINGINEIYNNKDIEVIEAGLRDGLCTGNYSSDLIPISTESLRSFALDADSPRFTNVGGIDLGLVELPSHVLRLIGKNPGAKFIDLRSNIEPDNKAIVGFFVIGVPGETVRRLNDVEWSVFTYFLPMRGRKTAPDGFRQLRAAWYGTLLSLGPPGSELAKIEGMSGGPVIAVERHAHDQYRFRIAGIQSSWRQPSRQVRWVPMTEVLNYIDREARSQQEAN